MFLTAGQSIFAVAVLTSLSFSAREAALIFVLFSIQLVLPFSAVRLGFGVLYIVLALVWFLRERRQIPPLFQIARQTVMQPSTANPHPPPQADQPEASHET